MKATAVRHPGRLGAFCLVAILRASPADPSASARPQPPTFPSSVEVVTIDAVVLDAHGRPVPGLTRDDFVVTEDGHVQEIAKFEAFVGQPAERPEEPAVVASNERAGRTAGRAFAVLVDDLGIAAVRTQTAREAVVSFLERSVRDGDEVTLATSSGDVWWSARIPDGREDLLAVLGRVRGRLAEDNALDRMTDYEAFWINAREASPALAPLRPDRPASAPAASPTPEPNPVGASIKERVKQRWKDANLCTGTSCDGMVRGRAADIDAGRRARTHVTLSTVRRGIEALAAAHGRKSLLLLSEGFLDEASADLREVAAIAREANAAIYFIDVRGLEALPGGGSAADAEAMTDPRTRSTMRFEEEAFESAGARALAEETGGFSVRNTNDPSAGVERIAEESRVFYLLGFYPIRGKSARDWRKLRVEVTRPGLKVRARRGYSLRVAAAGRDKKGRERPTLDPSVARALDSAHDPTDVPLRAMAYILEPRPQDTAHVVVAIEMDASHLAFQPRGTSRVARLAVSVVARNRDSGRAFRHDETVEVAAEGAEPPGWRALAREFELPAGVTQARVVVKDTASGAMGAVSQRFEIPPPSTLRLSTPILTDRLEPAQKEGERAVPALSAHRVFRPEGSLYCEFEVFGAARSADGRPQVAAGVEVFTGAGRLVRRTEPTRIATTTAAGVVRLLGLSLDGMEEGPYDLVLDVRDEVGGAHLKLSESFSLSR